MPLLECRRSKYSAAFPRGRTHIKSFQGPMSRGNLAFLRQAWPKASQRLTNKGSGQNVVQRETGVFMCVAGLCPTKTYGDAPPVLLLVSIYTKGPRTMCRECCQHVWGGVRSEVYHQMRGDGRCTHETVVFNNHALLQSSSGFLLLKGTVKAVF